MPRKMLLKPVRRLFKWLKQVLKSSETLRGLLYDLDNSDEFSDLYEHEKMLADSTRVNAYHAAIQRYIRPGDVVIDLGTGTGILAMFAAQRSAKMVYAIDHSSFISVAERIVKENQITNIRFLKRNSRGFVPDEMVDVILHEQIGDELFDENMVANLLDLKRRLLKPTGRVLPGKFELFLEPVCMKSDYRTPYIWEKKIHGIDFGFLKDSPELGKYERSDYHYQFHPPSAFDYFLCDASALLAFDLNEMKDPTEIPLCIPVSRTIRRSGNLDGFCLYFRVIFDDESKFDTSPFSPRTHWVNRLFRVESRPCRAGETIAFTLDMKDLVDAGSWSVQMGARPILSR